MLIFCDMCIDAWWQSGGIQNQLEVRRHDLTDCGFFPGIYNQQRLLSAYSTASLQIRSDDGQTVIDVSESGVTITCRAVTVNASSSVALIAPAVTAKQSGGSPQTLMTDAWEEYWVENILPFLQSKGYSGPTPPTNSLTTVLQGQ